MTSLHRPGLMPWATRVAALAMTLATPAGFAAPLGFKNSTTLKLTYSPPWSSADLNRAITRSDGFGVNLNWVETNSDGDSSGASHQHDAGNDPGKTAELWSFLTYTRLLRRWNHADSQANLWVDLGAGGVTSVDTTNPAVLAGAVSAGVALDWETQRLLLAAGARTLQAISASRNEATLKAGVALTPADYERIQPWIVVEARGMQGTTTAIEIIPSLRLLHHSFAIELGASLAGHPHVSLRYAF